MSQDQNRLNHATWECKYHVVFTPKYRKKLLFGQIRRQLGNVFRELARRKECQIEEGHLMPDHVHMLISIPPKYSVAEVIGYLKGKSSIWIAQNIERKLRNFLGHKFWASGLNQLKYWVEALKLDAGVGGCKAPVSFDIVSVALEEPGSNLALEAAPVRDPPIETLIG